MLKIKDKPTVQVGDLEIGTTFEYNGNFYIVTSADADASFTPILDFEGYIGILKSDTQVTKIDCEVTIL